MDTKVIVNDAKRVKEGHQLELQLAVDQQVDVLRKNWLSHDARWQMAVFQQFGWDAGNRLNKEVGRQMGKVAMHRLMKRLGITGVKNLSELRRVCEVAMDLFFPPPDFEYHFEQVSDTKLVGTIQRCVTYDNVKRVGVEKYYDCGCFAMRAGWYAALGINVEETLGKCLKAGDDQCEITLHGKEWEKSQKQAQDLQKEGF